MTKPITHSDVEDVLSSIRRLVGETRRSNGTAIPASSGDRLILTPQLRVSDQEVLMLEPEDAVDPQQAWQEYEEPPLAPSVPQHSEPEKAAAEDPLLLVTPVAPKPLPRTDIPALTAKIAALETAIAKTVDQWEPDGMGGDAYAGTQAPSMKWQEDVDLDATGRPVSTEIAIAVQTAVVEQIEKTGSVAEEHIIDEDMLRDIVGEIVRAELQGALGERITRNVRKLVRREIHRALTARSLD